MLLGRGIFCPTILEGLNAGEQKGEFPYSRGNCYNSWPRVVDKENSILGMDDKN